MIFLPMFRIVSIILSITFLFPFWLKAAKLCRTLLMTLFLSLFSNLPIKKTHTKHYSDGDELAQQIEEAEAKAPEDLTEEDKMALLGRPKNGDIIRAQLRIKESKEFKVSASW